MVLKPRLIEDWASVWQWGSARMLALTAAAPLVYEYMQNDPYMKDALSPRAAHFIMFGLSMLTLVSKLVRFDGKTQ